MQPITAETLEPHRIPSFAPFRSAVPSAPIDAYDRSAMKMDTVSPIPQSIQTEAKDFQSQPCGRHTILHFIATKEKGNTPNARERNDCINNAAENCILSAEKPCNKIKLENANQTPVQAADDGKNQCNRIHRFTSLVQFGQG